jgi:pimeloyl-ACP methyl ester carboxylesterase
MRVAKRLGLAFGLGGMGLLGATWWLGGRLTAPAHGPVGPPPGDLALDEVELTNERGERTRGWWHRGRGAGTIVLLHPLRSDRRAMLTRARLLAEAGFGSLLVDLRAHGESPGRRITFGLAESADARAAVKFAREHTGLDPVAAIGFSLGGAAALLGPAPLEVDALVLEAVYPSIADAIEARLALRTGRLVARLLAPLLLFQIRPRLGIRASELRPISALEKVRSPILVLAGTVDPKTPLVQSRRFFAAAPDPKELWEVEGAGHQDFLEHAPATYRERVLGFLARYLASGALLSK